MTNKTEKQPIDKVQKIEALNAKLQKIEALRNEQAKKIKNQIQKLENSKKSSWRAKENHIKYLFGAYMIDQYLKNPDKRTEIVKNLKDYVVIERESEHIDYFVENFDEMKKYSNSSKKLNKRQTEKNNIENEQEEAKKINEPAT